MNDGCPHQHWHWESDFYGRIYCYKVCDDCDEVIPYSGYFL